MSIERVWFRLMICPKCYFSMCWVNPRFPNYCPECGKFIYPEIKEYVSISDDNAMLRYEDK